MSDDRDELRKLQRTVSRMQRYLELLWQTVTEINPGTNMPYPSDDLFYEHTSELDNQS